MCSRVTCRACGLATWSGCGAHVDQVMRGIPKSERCTCERSGGRPGRATGSSGSGRSLLRRLLGR